MSDSSYATVQSIIADDPVLQGLFNRHWVFNYDQFLSKLYDDLVLGAKHLISIKHLIVEESEDATTARIQAFLVGAGYTCTFTVAGGNVDIEVRRKTYSWIGEAKRYTHVSAIHQGYQQLTTRYSPAINGSNVIHGGLLAYVRLPGAATLAEEWKEYLLKSFPTPSDCSFSSCDRFGPLGFYSQHTHESYGMPFSIWHICIPLHHDPKDKSGEATKARRAKKAANGLADEPGKRRRKPAA